MSRAFALAFLVVGILLLVMGIDAYHSVSSGMSRVFTGAPTQKAIWLLALGGIVTVAGAAGLTRRTP